MIPILVLTITALTAWLALVILITVSLNPFVQQFLDKRTQPREEWTTKPGERIEKVERPDYSSTTLRQMVESSLPTIVFAFVIILVLVPLGGTLVTGTGTMASLVRWLFVLCIVGIGLSFLRIPIEYWSMEWYRNHTILIILTANILYVKARISLMGLLTGKGALPKISHTEMNKTGEVKVVADPQDLDPKFHTGLIHDLWVARRNAQNGVATLNLLSFFKEATDTVLYLPQANGISKIIESLRGSSGIQAANIAQLRQIFTKEQGTPSDLDEAEAFRKAVEDKLLGLQSSPITFDVFTVQDPNHWTPDGERVNGQADNVESPRSYLEVPSD